MAHPGMNQKIEELFEYYAYPMIDFVRRNLSEIVKSMDNNLLQSIARLLMCHLV